MKKLTLGSSHLTSLILLNMSNDLVNASVWWIHVFHLAAKTSGLGVPCLCRRIVPGHNPDSTSLVAGVFCYARHQNVPGQDLFPLSSLLDHLLSMLAVRTAPAVLQIGAMEEG